MRELRVYRKVLAEAVPVVTPRDKPVAPQETIQASACSVPSHWIFIDQVFFARLNSQTRMALERLRVPRVRSTSPTRLATVFFSSARRILQGLPEFGLKGKRGAVAGDGQRALEVLGHQSSRLCLSSAFFSSASLALLNSFSDLVRPKAARLTCGRSLLLFARSCVCESCGD